MTRLTPDDAREAEIRRFLVNYDPQSDLPFLVGRLDAVRAELVRANEAVDIAIRVERDVAKADLAAAQARLADHKATLAAIRAEWQTLKCKLLDYQAGTKPRNKSKVEVAECGGVQGTLAVMQGEMKLAEQRTPALLNAPPSPEKG